MPVRRLSIHLVLGLVALCVGCTAPRAADFDQSREDGFLVDFRQDQVTSITQALRNWRDQGLQDVLGDADSAGLVPEDGRDLFASSPAALRAAILRYAEAQHGQLRTEPFPQAWSIRPEPYDAAAALTAALAQNHLSEWLQSLEPPFKAYHDLTVTLDRYRQIRAAGGWGEVGGAKPLKEGMTGAPVRALKERLGREGYDPGTDDETFDPLLSLSVAQFQQSHGITPTGIVDKATQASLNLSVDRRIAQIAANLERWRWLPRALPGTRIEVNIAAATATLIADGQPVLSMRAIVGRPADKTPMLEAVLDAVVLNPPWRVPPKIAAREILPKAQRDPSWFAREGYVLERDPRKPGSQLVRQLPGPRNALGRIKFDLPNPFDVYLHDTPARQLFGRDRRALSHGCVRVEKPLDLALAILKDDPTWSPERLDEAIAEGSTQRIALAEPIPVFLLYWTVFIDPDGVVNFRDDLYGWDEQLLHPRQVG